jgi:plastocyanin
MGRLFLITKKSVIFLCVLFVINSCTSSPENVQHKVYTVEIKDMKFQPAELEIQKGDTVVWINRDMVAHDVTEQPDKTWASSPLAMGQSWSLVAEKSADYYCSIHVIMKGKLVVK